MREVVRHTERDTGGWISGDTAYMLISSMPEVDIKPFLLPAQEASLMVQAQNRVPAVVATTLIEFP